MDVPHQTVLSSQLCKTRDDLDLIQLNSFGCGLDAVTTDCVNDILTGSGKIYTCLKIDEVNNLGAARIRIRSLLAAIRVKETKHEKRDLKPSNYERVVFTEQMKKDNYTIICLRCHLYTLTFSCQPLRQPATIWSYRISLQGNVWTWDLSS